MASLRFWLWPSIARLFAAISASGTLRRRARSSSAHSRPLWRWFASIASHTGAAARGESYFKVYRQFKMYNDPKLNPAVYGENAGEKRGEAGGRKT